MLHWDESGNLGKQVSVFCKVSRIQGGATEISAAGIHTLCSHFASNVGGTCEYDGIVNNF